MKKGGPEFVKRAPEGLSLFKITPPKACSFFAPRGAMCGGFDQSCERDGGREGAATGETLSLWG